MFIVSLLHTGVCSVLQFM